MSPLATYRERRPEGRRFFELFDDTIVVRGKNYLEHEFETPIALHTLTSAHGWIKTRSAGFWVTLPVAFLISVVLTAFVGNFLQDTEYLLIGIVAAAIVALLLTLFLLFRKIEFATFQNGQGQTVLTIGRAGPDKVQFDEFVKLLAKQIEKAHQSPNKSVERDAQ